METTEPILVAVEVPPSGDDRLKSWAKIVVAVDETKASGWAYEGDFVSVGGIQDLPIGGVLLVYGERGSRANPRPQVRVYRVNADATLSFEAEATGRAWARTLRDRILELLADGPPAPASWSPALMAYADDALIEELTRRGYSVDGPASAP